MTYESLSLSIWLDKFKSLWHISLGEKQKKMKTVQNLRSVLVTDDPQKKKKEKKERKEKTVFILHTLRLFSLTSLEIHYWLPFSTRRAPAGRAPTQKVPTHHGGSAQDRQTHTLKSTHCSTLSQTPSRLSNDSNPSENPGLNLIRHM